ncbi:MAG: hypothetical protein GVY14_10375 [Spirochaetes bacterium]|jgi:hypothetical protein|nr:hypothetical protein [Spirochaetota bacterium]
MFTRSTPVLLLTLFALAATSPLARSQDLFSDDLDTGVRDAYGETGRVFPTAVFPRSRDSLHRLLEDLHPSSGSRRSAERAAAALDFREGDLRLLIDLDLQPETYLEANREDLSFLESLEREEPLLRFKTAYGVDGGPQLVTQTVLQREYDVELPTNIPLPADGNPAPFENNFIYTGYLYVPGDYLSTTFGRQQVHFGPSSRSSLMASDRLPYLDAARVSLTLGRLRMTHLVSTIDNTASDAEIDAGMPEVLADTVWEHADQYAYGKNIIFYNVHYFEYAWDRLRLGIGGQMLISRPMNHFQLGDFFPVFSWHNADIVPNNMCLVLDASYAAAPGLEVYTQVGLDDVSAETFGIADSELPTIPAYIAGMRYRREADGPALSALLEVGHTHYLWGNFHEEFLLSRAIYRQNTDAGSESMPLTSPYGPGALWALVETSAGWDAGSGPAAGAARGSDAGRRPGAARGPSFDLGLSYLIRVENTRANLYSTPYRASEHVESAPRRVLHRVALRPVYRPVPTMGIYAEPALLVDDGELGFEATLGFAWRFSRVSRP